MRKFYALAAVVGTVVPWLFFAGYFAENGVSVMGFVGALFVNGAAGGFSADVLISIAVFWLWSFGDARRHRIRNWWTVIPAGAAVGLSLALPLYLWLREPVQHTFKET